MPRDRLPIWPVIASRLEHERRQSADEIRRDPRWALCGPRARVAARAVFRELLNDDPETTLCFLLYELCRRADVREARARLKDCCRALVRPIRPGAPEK